MWLSNRTSSSSTLPSKSSHWSSRSSSAKASSLTTSWSFRTTSPLQMFHSNNILNPIWTMKWVLIRQQTKCAIDISSANSWSFSHWSSRCLNQSIPWGCSMSFSSATPIGKKLWKTIQSVFGSKMSSEWWWWGSITNAASLLPWAMRLTDLRWLLMKNTLSTKILRHWEASTSWTWMRNFSSLRLITSIVKPIYWSILTQRQEFICLISPKNR